MQNPESQPFLQRVAQEIFDKYEAQLSDLQIVLPSRRAVLYMRHYLLEIVDKTFLSPNILSMDDFITNIAEVEISQRLTLLFHLFRVYKQFDDDPKHTLEQFAPLGTIILQDFDMIDKNLIDGNKLFDYLDKSKSLERWGQELGEELNDQLSETLNNYYEFWTFLTQTYHAFKAELLAENKAYRGLAYREVAENLTNLLENLHAEKIIFAGFNQLSVSEEQILKKLYEHKIAEIYWDSDTFYTDNAWHEAGHYLRKYKKDWHKDFSFDENRIRQNTKNIQVFAVNNKVTQAKLTGYLMQQKLAELQENDQMDSFKNKLNHTAILLPDETMLTPILYSLPVGKTAEFDLKNYVNVTMGLTMDKTPLFYLINNLFLMQDNLKTESTGELWIYHKDIINLLRHPYIQYSKNYSTDYPLIQQNIAQIQKENLIYVAQKELFEWGKNTDFYQILFKSWEGNTKIAIQTLHDLINALFRLFDPAFNVLENEYLLEFYKILQQLSQEIEKSKAELSLQTFKHFLYEVIRQESVPFTGDPLAPVQIMGLLESRALDFENVFILSCNEGILPKGKLMNSIIPFDIRKEFNLPTHLETDASYAYAFYRLFHAAKNITLIYYTSDAKNAVGGLEKSRFLAQIEAELSIFPNITFSQQPVLLSLPNKIKELFKVEKENPLMEKVEKYLQEAGITPSYMNMYLRNPLEFFEKKILKLGDPSEIEEMMLVNTFGTIVHKYLDKTLKKYVAKDVSGKDLQQIMLNEKESQKLIEEIVKQEKGGMIMISGKNFLLKNIAQYLIDSFLQIQVEKETPYYLVNQENALTNKIQIEVNGKMLNVKIWGKIDRIDIVKGNAIRIIDYKTGTYQEQNLKVNNIPTLLANKEKEKIVQLLIYKYLLVKALQNNILTNLPANFDKNLALQDHQNMIKSGFYFFRKLHDGFKEYKIEEEPKKIDAFVEAVENFIQTLVKDMLNTEKPFEEKAAFEESVGIEIESL